MFLWIFFVWFFAECCDAVLLQSSRNDLRNTKPSISMEGGDDVCWTHVPPAGKERKQSMNWELISPPVVLSKPLQSVDSKRPVGLVCWKSRRGRKLHQMPSLSKEERRTNKSWWVTLFCNMRNNLKSQMIWDLLWALTHVPDVYLTTGRSQERQWNLPTSCLETNTKRRHFSSQLTLHSSCMNEYPWVGMRWTFELVLS